MIHVLSPKTDLNTLMILCALPQAINDYRFVCSPSKLIHAFPLLFLFIEFTSCTIYNLIFCALYNYMLYYIGFGLGVVLPTIAFYLPP